MEKCSLLLDMSMLSEAMLPVKEYRLLTIPPLMYCEAASPFPLDDVRSGVPLLRLPFSPERGEGTGVGADDWAGVMVGLELGVGRSPLTGALLSSVVTWTWGPACCDESMMSMCSSDTSGWGRGGGCSVSGVSTVIWKSIPSSTLQQQLIDSLTITKLVLVLQ